MKYSFAPVINSDARLIILGTMPGDESLRHGQYYANPRNKFWHILLKVYNETIGTLYTEKIAFLYAKRLALWDVLKSGARVGSLDRDIQGETLNDFSLLFQEYPQLQAVAFNGGKAEDYFRRGIVKRHSAVRARTLTLISLPSTSPTPGRYVLPLDEKIVQWKAIVPFSTEA
jgi:double-stranded uracil-DNA glycosylase